MNHYTAIVSFELAKKLKEAGYPQQYGNGWYCEGGDISDLPFRNPAAAAPSYADVLDWLIDNSLQIFVLTEPAGWDGAIFRLGEVGELWKSPGLEEKLEIAMEKAIEKALEILKEKDNGNS